MYMIMQVTGVCALFAMALRDIRCKRVPVWALGCLFLGAFLSRILMPPEDGVDLALGVAAGLAFLLFSKLSREALGYGDSLLILILGVFVGFRRQLAILALAFLLAGIFAGVGLLSRRFSRTFSLPFIPFLAFSYVGVMLF